MANANSFVYGLAATSNQVFIGGNFTSIAGQSRPWLVALDINANTLTAWTPKPNLFVKAVQIFDNVLYTGGNFFTAGNTPTRSMAAYPLSLVGRPAIVSDSVRRLANGAVQFRLTALGVPQATIQFSTNLNNWQPLQTVSLVAGNGVFGDPAAPNYPGRFYRVSVP